MARSESHRLHLSGTLASFHKRIGFGPALFFLALALPTKPAFAESHAARAGSSGGDRRPTAQVSRRDLLRTHGLGLGYHAVFFRTESSDQYAVHGPSVAYDYFVGRRWGFMLRLAAFFPVLGSMHGPSGDFDQSLLGVYDHRRLGIDALFMTAHRRALLGRTTVTAAFGPHIQWFSLAGTAHSPVEEISLGMGGLGKVDYALSHWLSSSAEVATALDVWDLIDHRNPASYVVPLSCSFAITARY